MTIEEIIKEAFSRGWNASHECATNFDYDYALNGFLYEVESEVKKFRIGAVIFSKIIYTVIPYYSNGYEVNQNGVKSFTEFKKAEEYTWTLDYQFDLVENELI